MERKDVAVIDDEKPRFVLAAEDLAQQRGVAWESVLASDRERASNSTYPGPDCLLPDELEAVLSRAALLEAGRAQHVTSCRGCAALLASGAANPVELQRILGRVKSTPVKHRRAARPLQMSEALGKTARVGSVFLAAGVATVLVAKRLRHK